MYNIIVQKLLQKILSNLVLTRIIRLVIGMMGPPPGSKRPVDIRGPMVSGPPVGPGSAAAAAAAAAVASKNASSKKKRRLADKILPQKVTKWNILLH